MAQINYSLENMGCAQKYCTREKDLFTVSEKKWNLEWE